MNIDLATLLLLMLATWQAVEIWHHSSLFAGRRQAVEAWPAWTDVRRQVLRRLRRRRWRRWRAGRVRLGVSSRYWAGQLLQCPWCTSVWVGTVLSAAWYYLPPEFAFLTVGLAASRGANACNDIGHRYCRTPRATDLKTSFEEDTDDRSSPDATDATDAASRGDRSNGATERTTADL